MDCLRRYAHLVFRHRFGRFCKRQHSCGVLGIPNANVPLLLGLINKGGTNRPTMFHVKR
nr:MAG TPA: hypothetical protein [Caudoviricetes sp.]